MTFNPDIAAIDTVKAYHSGPQYVVEIDIVLDPEMPLWRAHDIAQDLQDQIEMLPDVDRCFVHVDHEVEHKPVSLIGSMRCGLSGCDGVDSTGAQKEAVRLSPSSDIIMQRLHSAPL
jgi:hypothetical protein